MQFLVRASLKLKSPLTQISGLWESSAFHLMHQLETLSHSEILKIIEATI